MSNAREILLASIGSRFSLFLWRLRLTFYGAVVSFFVFASIYGDPLFVSGNLHDAFIWLNSGYFIEEGLRPNIEFSTALGPAYIYLNYFARTVLQRQSDMPLFTGGIVFLALAALLIALRGNLHKAFLPDTLFILFILLLSGRHFGDHATAIHWYGIYNRMGWACLFLFAVLLISREEALLRPTERQQNMIAAVVGLLLAFLLMLKISFFVALGIMYVGWIAASSSFRNPYVLYIPLAIVAACTATVHFLVVDIGFYLADILDAAQARTGEAGISVSGKEIGAAILFVVSNCVIDRWTHPQETFDVKRFCLWVAMALALACAVLGDFSKPVIFFGVFLAARVFYRYEKLFSDFLHTVTVSTFVVSLMPVFIMSFVVLETSSLMATAIWKLGGYPEDQFRRVVWQLPGGGNKTIDFLIVDRKNHPEFSALAEIIDTSPDRANLFEKISMIEGGLFRYGNGTYVDMIDEAVDVIRNHGAAGKRSLALEFSNPLPLLLGGPPPVGAPLWIHEGTTFAKSETTLLDRAFANAEIVIVPHATIDADMRPLLNGMFASYNVANRRFCKFHTGKYWMFYELCR